MIITHPVCLLVLQLLVPVWFCKGAQYLSIVSILAITSTYYAFLRCPIWAWLYDDGLWKSVCFVSGSFTNSIGEPRIFLWQTTVLHVSIRCSPMKRTHSVYYITLGTPGHLWIEGSFDIVNYEPRGIKSVRATLSPTSFLLALAYCQYMTIVCNYTMADTCAFNRCAESPHPQHIAIHNALLLFENIYHTIHMQKICIFYTLQHLTQT